MRGSLERGALPRRGVGRPRRVPAPPACRCCGAPLTESFADLGVTPIANAYVAPDQAMAMEPCYPLHALVCAECHMVQLPACQDPPALFADYISFSSVSGQWLRQAEAFAGRMAALMELGPSTPVLEVASNDGYLLQYFARLGIPVLGVDPAANVAQAAMARGIPTEIACFGSTMARRLRATHPAPVLMVANNVLGHVPDIHDFIEGFRILLAPGGVATFEFPHLLRLMQQNQFDTIHHEHLSYLSLQVAELLFCQHGLVVYDVEELPSQGGSLRLFVRHAEDSAKPLTPALDGLRRLERAAGLGSMEAYRRFARGVVESKCALLDFLVGARRAGQRVVGYGAPSKGNTLLNYCGVGPELLPFTVDLSPHKQGLLLPGSRIPIRGPEAIMREKPDFVLILPWNLQDEVAAQMAGIRAWGGRFVVPIPAVALF